MTADPLAEAPQAAAPLDRRELRDRALGGMAWLAGGRLVAQTTTLASRVVLARILGPAEFAQVAMASTVVDLLELMAGRGMGVAVVQSEELSERKRSTAFWGTALQGMALAGLAFAVTPLLGLIFRDDEVTRVAQVMIAGSALLSPASVFEALFARRMNFRNIVLRKIVASLLGAALGVGLALAGLGVWALVAQRLGAGVLFFGLAVASSRWRPTLTFSLADFRELASVSVGSSAAAFTVAAARQIPTFAIGRLLGAEPLGYYAIARQVVVQPLSYLTQPVQRVMLATLSRLQSDLAAHRAAYLRAQRTLVLAAAAVPALVGSLSPVAVPAVLGAKWGPAVPLVQILAVPATIGVVAAAAGAAVNSLGKTRLLVLVAVTPVLLQAGGLALGVRGGLEGAALGWAAGAVVGLVVQLGTVAVAVRAPARALLAPLAQALPPAAACAVTVTLITRAGAGLPGLGVTAVAAVLGLGAYAAVLRATAPEEFRWILGRLRDALARRRRGRPGRARVAGPEGAG